VLSATAPYDTPARPGLDKPVTCVCCGLTVADLTDPDLEEKLPAHLCTDARRWVA
jgi:hypothetical protein